ncbi:hypothetical protein CEP54_010221 [Fusarium duplospermum]|uniref:Uncharacterized protein n=1 Tax=Fusarium duplospermum TaxID=1325734 RepID=A0A428PL98_9HYPO|nr:hypothetical protein CEP54_010221 [Fusarium duplospermum]
MAHFDLGNLEEARKLLCGLGSSDEEIRRQGQANFESVCPKDKYSDPYVVAVLIALAQQQRLFLDSQPEKPDPKGKRPEYVTGDQICASYKSRSFLVHVFVTCRGEPGFHLYKAIVPIQLLDRLDDPGRFNHSTRLIVNQHRINLGETSAVLEELSRALGLPIDQPPPRNNQ